MDRVVIRDGDAIGQLLTRLGAHESLMAWEARRMRAEAARRLATSTTPTCDVGPCGRRRRDRVERALEILGEEIPDHLRQAGKLRLEHKQASLEELGQLHNPVLTKDAIAGRIRRLLAMADKRAEELGIPNTEASLTAEMLAEDASDQRRHHETGPGPSTGGGARAGLYSSVFWNDPDHLPLFQGAG